MKTTFSVLVLAVVSLQLISAAKLARNCNSKWSQGVKCYKDSSLKAGVSDSSFPVPSDNDKKKIDTAVNDCFIKRFQCPSSPVPTQQQNKDRLDCFNQMKKTLQQQLQTCVKRSVEDFTMPDDSYDPTTDWGYKVTTVKNAINNPNPICPSKPDKKQLQFCVTNAGYDFMNKKPPNKIPTPYQCQSQANCWQAWTADCQNTWEFQIVPQLCQCSQDMQKQKMVATAQNQYKNCLASKGQTAAKDDPVLKWVDTYLRNMCTTASSNPCKKEFDTVSKRMASQIAG